MNEELSKEEIEKLFDDAAKVLLPTIFDLFLQLEQDGYFNIQDSKEGQMARLVDFINTKYEEGTAIAHEGIDFH